MQPLPLKLAPGSDLRLSLEELAQRDGISGFVLGVVGNLTKASFQCPGQAEPTVLEGDLEVITLNGTFSPEGVHLHLSLSDGACQVWGGHLEPGTIVQKGVDLLIGVLEQREGRPARQTAAAAAPRIEIAVLPGCPWCSRALRILRTLDLPHNRHHRQRRRSLPGRAAAQWDDHLPPGVHRRIGDWWLRRSRRHASRR